MILVKIKPGEPFEKAMRKFKRKVETEGLMREIKKRQFHMTKSQRRKEKRKQAEKRRRKAEIRNLKYKK
jgi:small subunit ribosomal protein S21